jgi:hypothetical protein
MPLNWRSLLPQMNYNSKQGFHLLVKDVSSASAATATRTADTSKAPTLPR